MRVKPGYRFNSDKNAAVVLAVSVLSVYLFTLLPGIHTHGDVTKWQYLGSVLGTPHPTGYPLYLLLTHLVSKIPFFTLAWKINAFSAICMTTAVIGLFTMLRQVGLPRVFSALSAMCFAFSTTVWSQAVVAEVYALNAALVAWTSVLFIAWHKTESLKYFFAACLLYSLSFGNHLTVVCLLPAVVLLTLMTDLTLVFRPRVFLPVLLFILLGMSLYLYIFWRSQVGGVHLEYRITDFAGFKDYISGGHYRDHMFSSTAWECLKEKGPEFLKTLWKEFHLLSLFGLLGLFAFKRRALGIFILCIMIGYSAFIMNYTIPDIAVYYIPIYLFIMILIAKGFWFPLSRMEKPWIPIVKHVLILMVAVSLFLTNIEKNDLSDSKGFERRIRHNLDLIASDSVLMLEGWGNNYGTFEGLMYYLYAENTRERNIYVVARVSPKRAIDYLKGKAGLFSEAMDQEVPPGLSLFVFDIVLADAIAVNQISVVKEGTDLYRLYFQAPGGSAAFADVFLDVRLEDIVQFEGTYPFEQEITYMWERHVAWRDDRQIAQLSNSPGLMAVRIHIQESGDYSAEFNLTHAPDYGIVSVSLDEGEALASIDLYAGQITSKTHRVQLKAIEEGDHIIEFRVSEKNQEARGYGLGLDFIMLKKN